MALPSLASAQVLASTSRYISFVDALPTLETLAAEMPEALAPHAPPADAARWDIWVRKADAEVRARLAQGDEDSLINLILLGSNFTQQPRATQPQIDDLRQKTAAGATLTLEQLPEAIRTRFTDFLQALAQSGTDERLVFAREFLSTRLGQSVQTATGQTQARDLLLVSLTRVLKELTSFEQIIAQVKLLNDDTATFVQRSEIYSQRGLSSDTSLRPNYGIEAALKELLAKGLLSAGAVKRVGIVGPGLDFADKQSGYDFYPQQTIQPFALMDSLIRLGLAAPDQVRVTTLDLSPKVNAHIQRAQQQGLQGKPYVVQLPWSTNQAWTPELTQYWKSFGDQVGTPTPPAALPANVTGLELRAVEIKPTFVARVNAVDTNIVLQYLELADGEKFDLIVGTNIFVYYDGFQKSLALANVAKMLRPGGFLLSNQGLLEIPSSRVKWTGYTKVQYSTSDALDGDFIVWYRRVAD